MFLPTVEEHAHQHSSFVGFLTGVRGHLFVLICISLIFSDTEDLFMCLLAIWMASIKILNHHVVHLKYYIINQLYFNKRAICKKKIYYTLINSSSEFSKPLESHIFLQPWHFPPVAHELWVRCGWYGCDLYTTSTSVTLQPSVCDEPAGEQVDMDPGGLGGGGPQGSPVPVCLHPSAPNSLLKVTAATSPSSPTSHASSSFVPFLLEPYSEGDSGKPSSTWPK